MQSRGLVVGVTSVALFAAPVLRAEPDTIDARRFRPPTDPAGSLYLEPPATPGNNAFNAAEWISYAWRPVVQRDGNGAIVGTIIRHQVVSDLIVNMGVSRHAAFGLDLPIALWQMSPRNAATDAASVPGQALGDLAFVLKGYIVPEPARGGFGMAFLGRFAFSLGSAASYLGEGTSVTELRMLGQYRFGGVAIQATAGLALRSAERNVLGATYASEIPWGVGVSIRPAIFGWDSRGRWTLTAEFHGPLYLPPSSDTPDTIRTTPVSPMVAGVSARCAVGHDVSLVGGAQFGLTNALGSAPVQVMGSLQWAPRSHDEDDDGVPDDRDHCPALAEDRDGFQDGDGCPDMDNDGDGVPDSADRCVNEKEDADGFRDDDGCPDPDNDQDGIPDAEDACPSDAGPKSSRAEENGCPDKDRKGMAAPEPASPQAPAPESPREPELPARE